MLLKTLNLVWIWIQESVVEAIGDFGFGTRSMLLEVFWIQEDVVEDFNFGSRRIVGGFFLIRAK